MRLFFLLHLMAFFGPKLAAQVTFNGQGGLPIPPGAPGQTVGITQSPCVVSGVGIIGGCVSIANVTIDIQHTFVGDIAIFLIGPGGQVLEFSSGNGGAGDNFTNTVFTDAAPNFITTGFPPYTGTFRPEGRVTNLTPPFSNAPALGTFTFANTFNGTDADGTWNLYINDYVAADVGVINSWSITFNTSGTPPVADAGDDVTVCAGASTTLTATGGDTYQWSTGDNTASTSVSPSNTTTYTVTVTAAGCGSDTDEVTVTVQPASVTITASPPVICAGESSTLTAFSSLGNYLWSTGQNGNSITVSQGGSYTVTATDGSGCSATETYDIAENNIPTVSMTADLTAACAGDCRTIEVSFTGVAPFDLSGELQVGGVPVNTFNQTFGSSTGSFVVCVPPGAPPGSFSVVATQLSDAFCTCE